MPRVQRSALLPYRAADVFAIVNDIGRYPEFLPWCSAAAVLSASEEEVLAELSLSASGIRETFTTRNRLVPFERIEMALVSGPFRRLSGGWTFTRLGNDQGCRVALELDFQLAGMQSLLGGVFNRAADQMVDAFSARAEHLLGSA
ncbi:MAG TPA: type II toxin-antitoxin system RatA family toxin [Pseudomonadales bacterium]